MIQRLADHREPIAGCSEPRPQGPPQVVDSYVRYAGALTYPPPGRLRLCQMASLADTGEDPLLSPPRLGSFSRVAIAGSGSGSRCAARPSSWAGRRFADQGQHRTIWPPGADPSEVPTCRSRKVGAPVLVWFLHQRLIDPLQLVRRQDHSRFSGVALNSVRQDSPR